ncbi:methylglyoxal synthase [Amygdalobacter indicium]|uniref:Methylglyoxal synthase n=1 Tax=Amygdalobacter indicium TaxID=3029272 RepID=A0ABY8C415_9FIRM|nr:methylglyoxal synthase [Amygdalobacter indicium]WEG33854.1 methylglyoxal synthase [Amygdalobacter indicium]WEG35431.1 methylglyoxal synthase [Amygdalobacter indicium]
MRIVLLADNRKNELLINFCIAYKQLLKRHQLLSTLNLARLLEENVGLNVTGVPSDLVGGLGQITQRVGYNEIDAVIHLRDTRQQSTEYNKYSRSLLDICDVNTIPYASNIATAEILILAIDRGDLDWRELVH